MKITFSYEEVAEIIKDHLATIGFGDNNDIIVHQDLDELEITITPKNDKSAKPKAKAKVTPKPVPKAQPIVKAAIEAAKEAVEEDTPPFEVDEESTKDAEKPAASNAKSLFV
jgi:hypothetical protein